MQFTNLDENTQVRLAKLKALDVPQRLEIYEGRMAETFNEQVKFRSFGVDDLVLTIRRLIVINRKTQGKFESKWKGPYGVNKVLPKWPYEFLNYAG